jgi:hypothetical protein
MTMSLLAPDPGRDADDAGFITPVFAGLGLAMVLIAAAFLLTARQDLATARTASSRQAEQLRLEGLVAVAAWRLRETSDLRWRAWSEAGGVQIAAEPEGRKINPLFADRPDNLVIAERLVGPAHAEAVTRALVDNVSAARRLARRDEIVAVSADARWRACAASAFSAYSQQTALTLEPAAARAGQTGEIWRIVVSGRNGAFVDQVIRFSSDPTRSFDILEHAAGHTGGAARLACQRLIHIA